MTSSNPRNYVEPNKPWAPAFGAQVGGDSVRFAVWAPNARVSVSVVLHEDSGAREVPMSPLGDGRYEAHVPGVTAGSRYAFRLDGGEGRPDPYSRYQPEGVHGPSQLIDPATYAWGDLGWRGISREGLAIYELHVGTFTPEGTFRALIGELPSSRRSA